MVANTPASRKAKGRKFQQYVRDCLLEAFQQLEEDDIKSTGMGQAGEDLQLSPAARRHIPYSFECKNQETVSLWSWWGQAKANAKTHNAALVIKSNHKDPVVVLEYEHFVAIIKELDELRGKK